MNRRGFLRAFLSAAAVAAIDPEELIWQPGKKLISIPEPVVSTHFHADGNRFLTIEDVTLDMLRILRSQTVMARELNLASEFDRMYNNRMDLLRVQRPSRPFITARIIS